MESTDSLQLLTTDPEGEIRWWELPEALPEDPLETSPPSPPRLLATFESTLRIRILSAHLSLSASLLLCGDQTGHCTIFYIISIKIV